MIDTHCHLYSEEFLNDIGEVLEKAAASGIAKFYMPAIDSSTHAGMIAIAEKYNTCFAMIGLHPCSVKEDYETELKTIAALLKERKFAAIGETGLDFYWDKNFIKEQYIALEKQIKWALEFDLPLVLHTRNATQETIDVVKKYSGTGLKGIFHCFGGSLDEAEQIIATGFYLGIGGVVTYKNGGLDKILPFIDIKHLVLETDAPYLSPVPLRGKRNEPGNLDYIAKKIAEIKSLNAEEVKKATSINAENIFK